jgi:hypothetical protein
MLEGFCYRKFVMLALVARDYTLQSRHAFGTTYVTLAYLSSSFSDKLLCGEAAV